MRPDQIDASLRRVPMICLAVHSSAFPRSTPRARGSPARARGVVASESATPARADPRISGPGHLPASLLPSPAAPLLLSGGALLSAGSAFAEAVDGVAGFDWNSPVGLAVQLSPIVLYGLYRSFLDPLKDRTTATASHILVDSEEKASELKAELLATTGAGEPLATEFSRLATANSTCPSAERGGLLGKCRPGQMVKEFNDVIFNDEIGVVHGPVKTTFGFHLVLIDERTDKDGN